jgi:hypothetical protein
VGDGMPTQMKAVRKKKRRLAVKVSPPKKRQKKDV